MRKKLLCIAAVLLNVLLIWLIIYGEIPHPHSSIIMPYNSDILEIEVLATELNFEKGVRYEYHYDTEIMSDQDEMWTDILDILNSASYYNTLTNLISWLPDSFSAKPAAMKGILIVVATEQGSYSIMWDGEECITFIDYSDRKIKNNGIYKYHLVDKAPYDRLMAYLQSNLECQIKTFGPGNMPP